MLKRRFFLAREVHFFALFAFFLLLSPPSSSHIQHRAERRYVLSLSPVTKGSHARLERETDCVRVCVCVCLDAVRV